MFTEYPVHKGRVRSSTVLNHKGISQQKGISSFHLRHKQPAETPLSFMGPADAAELSAEHYSEAKEKFPSQRVKFIGMTCRKELMQFNNSNGYI